MPPLGGLDSGGVPCTCALTCRLSPVTPGTAALSAMILLFGFMIALSALIGRFSGAEGEAVSMMTWRRC